MRFAEVAVDAPVGSGRTFSYSIPSSLDVRPGQVVRVPFGPRKLQGVVFSLARQPGVPETRDILSVPDTGLLITDERLQLASWISDYYACSLFEAVAPMLPPGGRFRQKTYYSLAPDAASSDNPDFTPNQSRLLGYVRARSRVEESRLLEATRQRSNATLTKLVELGLLNRSQEWAGGVVGPQLREYVKLAPHAPLKLADELRAPPSPAPRQAALAEHLRKSDGPIAIADARKEYGSSAVNGLLDKGWLEKETVRIYRDPLEGRVFSPAP